MKKIELKNDGEMDIRDIKYFGGKYSLLERIKKKGIGSPKIIYESGIDEFDRLNRNVAGEIGFVNFELLKNGLILRMNLNRKYGYIGIRLHELTAINLVGYRVAIKQKKFGKTTTTIIHRGELEILELDERLKFSVLVKDFKGITNFFQKEELAKKFNFSINSNSPENDNDYLFRILDKL
jgi:hypothetical protein